MLEPQPDYPVVDLTLNNTNMFGSYWLINEPGVEAQVKILFKHQRLIFSVGVIALGMQGVRIEDAPVEYVGFRRGFASVEFMADILRFPYNDGDTMIRNAQTMLGDGDFFDANGLAERSKEWYIKHPNTYEAVLAAGVALGESMPQLQARSVGAQVALELRDPLLAA